MKTYTDKQYIELFHLLFLSQLARKVDKKLYVLKGGCNMRFFFKSIRYSEDIDIDIRIVAVETLKKNINSILNSTPFRNILKSYGLEISSSNAVKQTETTQRWKVTLKAQNYSIPINTKIEFSRRSGSSENVNYEALMPSILKQYSLMPIMANHYNHQDMYEQKIKALARRSQTQARDVFDLYFLISTGLAQQVSSATSQDLPLAIINASRISFSDFKGQVVAYLEADYQAEYDEHAWINMLKIVINSLESNSHETS